MNGPRRLAESDDQAMRLVMDAALSESAPPGGRQRALVALGVATAAAGAAAGAKATALAAKGATGASANSAAKGGAALVFAKWMGGGAAIGLVVSTGAIALSPAPTLQPRGAQVTAPSAAQASVPASVVPPAQAAGTPDPLDVQPDEPAPLPAPRVIRKANASDVAPPGPAAPGAPPPTASYSSTNDGLAAEVRLLDEARSALSSGASTRALGLLAQHQRQYPRSRLANEAFVMRLDALSRSGQRDRARQLASAYLARRPNAPHAARIRRLVGLAPEKK